MEKNLEHKIAEAYQKKDNEIYYPKKKELWDKISKEHQSKSVVHGFWRIAAILLAVFFITGAFAGFVLLKKNLNQLATVEKSNYELRVIVDSLQNIFPRTITEIKYIKKEVKVFVPVENKINSNKVEQEQFLALKNENSRLNKQLVIETTIWKNKTDSLLQEIVALNNTLKDKEKTQNKLKNPSSNVVELKPEKFEMPLQQPTHSANPKLKIQIFQNPDEKTNFDMNSSILKK
jgi:hypothetical protein